MKAECMKFFGRRRKKEKSPANEHTEMLHNLGLLARVEGPVAQFYTICSQVLSNENDLWKDMAASKRRHVEHIHRMRDLVCNAPQDFRPGADFNSASVRLFEIKVRNLPDREEVAELDRYALLGLIEEIEDSAVARAYGKAVVTQNEEFILLAREIEAETSAHQQTIAELTAALKA